MSITKIFNAEKSDYETQGLFLGQDNGLADTINRKYPEIRKLYKTMKKMDWDENEFDYSPCNVDFKTCNPSIYNMMIKTLAWQWEADSVASRSILPIMAPFISSTELFECWAEITKNECVHSATYSEIVRSSFDNPNEVLKEVLEIKEALSRLSTVAKAMAFVYDISHKVALGMISKDSDQAYEAAILATVALLCLERIQFMSSFAVTFAICDTGLFNSIGKAVQKIAQDELEIHVALDKEVIRIESKTDRYQRIYPNIKDIIQKMVDEVVQGELDWVTYLFSDGDELVGVSEELLKQWSLFNAKDVYKFLKLESPYELPKQNPLKFMEKWLDISKTQPSPQEEDNGQYKLNSVRRDDDNTTFDVDF